MLRQQDTHPSERRLAGVRRRTPALSSLEERIRDGRVELERERLRMEVLEPPPFCCSGEVTSCCLAGHMGSRNICGNGGADTGKRNQLA